MSKRSLGFMNKSALVTYNTYIGGVSATISTDALLATKLGISVGRISNFTIVGSDIKCKITGSYQMPIVCWSGNTSITYYTDSDGLVTYLKDSCFYGTTNIQSLTFINATNTGVNIIFNSGIKEICLDNCTTINSNSLQYAANLKIVYIPRCTSLGTTSGNNGVFAGISIGIKIYTHPSLATNNGGSPDGDLTSQNVGYVTNFTAPSPIADLSAGTIYNTAIQLNFTPPSSTNSIDFYECYANGVFKNNITASGGYIAGLAAYTSYNITVIAVDIFYNKSNVSNSLSLTTTNNSNDITNGLVSYYKLDETSGIIASDSFQSRNLTNTGITTNQTGKIGTSYLSTVASQKLETNSAISILQKFTMNAWIYRTANCPDYACVMEYQGYANNRGFGIWLISNQISWVINQNYAHNIAATAVPLNTWVMVTVTYDGTNVKVYLDAVLKQTTANTVNPKDTNVFRLFYNSNNNANFLGRIDEASTYNIALNQTEIDVLYNSGNGITL